MTCRDTRPLLPLFFDGELEARQMRAVALHSTRCPECEGALRQLEQVQELIVAHVDIAVDAIDASRIWAGVAPRLVTRPPTLVRRMRDWWGEQEIGWGMRVPVLAGAAVTAALVLGVWMRDAGPSTPADVATRMDNSAVLDSVQSSVDSVALVTDAETNTTLLWIMDDAAGAVDHIADEWEADR